MKGVREKADEQVAGDECATMIDFWGVLYQLGQFDQSLIVLLTAA